MRTDKYENNVVEFWVDTATTGSLSMENSSTLTDSSSVTLDGECAMVMGSAASNVAYLNL